MLLDALAAARDLVAFIHQSPTAWHCAAVAAERLARAGFSRCAEASPFAVAPGGGGFLVRDGLVLAFRLGLKPPTESGFRLIGAHTDSPHLRLKPTPDVTKAGYRALGVELYGGVLYHTWLDRDLALAGRIFVKRGGAPFPETRLIHVDQPLCRIPSLAIHLNREVNQEGLKLNPQEHLVPHFAVGDHSEIIAIIAQQAQLERESVVGWDLALLDHQPPTLGGLDEAFVFAPRLDNQASTHAALSALIGAEPSDATQVIALYDHEEVGSLTPAGADGPLVERLLTHLATGRPWGGAQATSEAECLQRAIARSWHVSADMAHAVHPNYADRHEPQHRPALNAGPVVKSNANQRYATTGETAALFEALAAEVGVKIQHFVTRTDLACGTTIGPIAAGRLGVRTVDVGNPMLSMHSAREQAGSHDVAPMIAVMTAFLEC